MKLRSLKYFIKEGVSGLLKNRLMTFASMGTVAACILIMTFSVCIVSNLTYVLEQIEDTIGIVVFLDDELSADEIAALNTRVSSVEHVTEVIYVTPEEAFEQLKSEWDEEDILEGFDNESNPLSHSFEISLDSIENQTAVLTELESMSGIQKIRHAQNETEILLKINRAISIMGIVVILILALISIIIITNTIKISVYTRRTEINIMKFVGATDWFVRWPFIIEGMVIGIIGAGVPMLLSWPAYAKIIDLIYTNLPIIVNIAKLRNPSDIFSILIPIAMTSGIFLGIVGSITSIKKHLKV